MSTETKKLEAFLVAAMTVASDGETPETNSLCPEEFGRVVTRDEDTLVYMEDGAGNVLRRYRVHFHLQAL
jgi:hypothetical protein